MSIRLGRTAILFALFAAGAFGVAGAPPAAAPAPKPTPPPDAPASHLFKTQRFPGFDDPETTFADALGYLTKPMTSHSMSTNAPSVTSRWIRSWK